jgi:protein SCO1/2
MSEQTTNSRGRLAIVGFVLWGAVFVSLFFMWKQRNSDSTVKGDSDSELVVIKGNGSNDVPGDEDTGVPEPIEIKITWPEEGVRDFALTDSREETLSKNDLLGKPWIASFIFTRCAGPCPRVAAAFKELQKRYPEPNVNLVTFTVDPDHDTPEVLTKFASFWEADLNRWFFLTGDPTPGWEIIHTTNICLVDATGNVVGKYNSLKEDEIALLRRDLDALLNN